MNTILSGLKAWVWQRLSALVILAGTLYFFYHIFTASWDYLTWRSWITQDLRLALILIYISALLIHSWIGIRNVILDYIKPFSLRLMLLLIFGFFLSTLGIWVCVVLIRSAHGA